MVPTALANALVALCEAPMTGPSETLPVLESRLAERRLAFETMEAAWPKVEYLGDCLLDAMAEFNGEPVGLTALRGLGGE